MKRYFKLLTVCILVAFSSVAFAQKSVSEATDAAKKLQKKITKRQFNDFKESYPKALKEIADIEAAAGSEFGYDAIADNAPDWIGLNNYLKDLGTELSFKDETVKLVYKDYHPLLEEARLKAAQAHYDAAIKIIETEKEFAKKEEALDHFNKCFKYDYKKEYADRMTDQKASMYYNEGLRIYKTATSFEEKVKCKEYFSKARTKLKDYKDINELLAKIYFDEAVKLSKSLETNDLINANNYFTEANKQIENFQGCQKLKESVRIKIAETLYQKALAKEKEKSFKAQAEATEMFNNVGTWVEGYKDAAAKACAAKIRSKAYVLVIESDGSCVSAQAFVDNLGSKINRDMEIDMPSELKGVDMNNPANYVVAKEKTGYGFILIKLSQNKGLPKFSKTGPVTTTTNEKKYFEKKMDQGKVIEKEIDETTYKTSVKIQQTTKQTGGFEFFVREGVTTKTVESVVLEINYTIEIWDLRDPKKPIKLDEISETKTYNDSKTNMTYSGDPLAQPRKMINDQNTLKTEQELKALAESNNPRVSSIVKVNADEISKKLNAKITYK